MYCATCGSQIDQQHLEGKQENRKAELGVQCILCRNDAVVSNKEVQTLFSADLVHFFNNVLGLPLDEWELKVSLVEHNELRTTGFGVDHVHTGECISSVAVHHVRSPNNKNSEDLIHTREVKEIRLLKGMHVELVARTIAHEAMHGWIALWYGQPCGVKGCFTCPKKLNDVVAEGLCEFAAWRFLEHRQKKLNSSSHRYKVIEHTKAKMLTNTSGVYAKGLKLARGAFSTNDNHLNRAKNASFFKQVFALSTFPIEGKVSTPIKGGNDYNGEISASLGHCLHCYNTIEPSSTTKFEFVVLGSSGSSDGGSGSGGSGSGGGSSSSSSSSSKSMSRRNTMIHASCACLPCYEETRPKCKWCDEPLYLKPTVSNQNLHSDCFLEYEKKYGDKCYICNETLWEIDTSRNKGGKEDNRELFVRRSSFTVTRNEKLAKTKNANDGTKREVHVRCGDRCALCNQLFINESFISIQRNKEKDRYDQLHEKCMDNYQIQNKIICCNCNQPLWNKNKVTNKYERRTRILNNKEIHIQCGPKCSYCTTLLNGKYITIDTNVSIHYKCFDKYQIHKNIICGVCSKPLWRRDDNKTNDFSKRTIKIKNKINGKRDLEVHIECSDKCAHCTTLLILPSPNEKNSNRSGSIVTINENSNLQVHDSCYLLYQNQIPSECCHSCNKGLWHRNGTSFQRRSSVTQDNLHLCKECAKSYVSKYEGRR
jgi:hypothetical protein